MVAGATAACILLYDAWGKRQTWVGPVNMGLCRAGNLMLGVAAAPEALRWAWPLGVLPLVYITAVTTVSRGEVHGGKRAAASFALISLLFVLLALLWLSIGGAGRGVSPAGLVSDRSARCPASAALSERAGGSPAADRIRQAVRTGVLSLVLVDAVLGAVYAGADLWRGDSGDCLDGWLVGTAICRYLMMGHGRYPAAVDSGHVQLSGRLHHRSLFG